MKLKEKILENPECSVGISMVAGALIGSLILVGVDQLSTYLEPASPVHIQAASSYHEEVCYNHKGERVHLSRYYPPIDPRGHLGIERLDPDISRCEIIESE